MQSRAAPVLDIIVWLPYISRMYDKDMKKTAVELRIQQSILDDHDDPDIQRLRKNHICFALLSLVNQFYKLERQCRNFGTDVEIHLAEIQMIMTIHNAQGIHVNGLAQKLGITKGSVSEMLRKLERKGLVHKEKDPLKMTRLNIYLTDKGLLAHQNHICLHQKLDNLVLEAASEHGPELLKSFTSLLNDILMRLAAFSKG